MEPSNVTFLTEEQLFGNQQLDVLKVYGIKMAITDFATLTGGFVNSNNFYTSEGESLKDRACIYWSGSPARAGAALVVNYDGYEFCFKVSERCLAARPASLFSDIFQISPNGVRGVDGLSEIEYGEYPQQAVDKKLQKKLESEYQNQKLIKTGKKYTTDATDSNDYSSIFKPHFHEEYEYNGKRYVRVIAKLYNESTALSNGATVSSGDVVWTEVQPIKWLVDEASKLIISKYGIYAGIQFDDKGTNNYQASSIKIYNELRFAVECTRNQMAPKEYILGEEYKRIPANAFSGIKGLEKVVLSSTIQEIGVGAFEGFGFISKQKDGLLAVSKEQIPGAVWEFNLSERSLIHIATNSDSKPIIYVKNKYGKVDLITETSEKTNICELDVFNKLKEQNLIEALDSWLSLRDEYKSKSPLHLEVFLATDGEPELYRKFFQSKVTGFDQLIKSDWYASLSSESKEDLMKLFISLGGFETKSQRDVLMAIAQLQEEYQEHFDAELHHLFMNVPKGVQHVFGPMDGKEGIFSFSRTILNFLQKYKGSYKKEDFKTTIATIVSNCPKVYQAYRKYLRNLNPAYAEATNPDASLYEKMKNEGLSASFVLQWLSSEKYVYLANDKLKQRLMHLPQGVTVAKETALQYEQLLDRDIPQIIASVRSGQRKRNKYFVNQVDDGREVDDDNSSGIHYEWAEINKINALTCGEFMQTCFRPGRQNSLAFYNCIDNPEDAFMMLYDGDHLAGYCRVRYYPAQKGILVDNVELSHYAGDVFSDSQRQEFASRCLKGLLDMAKAMNEIGYPVERIYSKQDNWADGIILNEWKKQFALVTQLTGISPMPEVTYTSPRKAGSYHAGNVGEQIVIMEETQRGRKR